MNKQELLDKLNWLMDAYSSDGGFSSGVRTGLAIAIAEIEKLDEPEKVVEKEKLYTVKLANGDCLYKFKDIEVGWTNGYSNYKNDKDFQLTQAEIESVDPVLMKIAKEVE